MRNTEKYTFETLSEFEQVVEEIGKRYTVEKHDRKDSAVLCKFDTESDTEWKPDFNRSPLAMKRDGEIMDAAAVAQSERWYTPIEFSTPLQSVASRVPKIDDIGDISGSVAIKRAKKMVGDIKLNGVEATDATGSNLDISLRIRTAHTGFNAVKFEIGAERLVCSNGMKRFVPETQWSHGHNEGKFNSKITHEALVAAVNSPTTIHERTVKAHEQQFSCFEEALLSLLHAGEQISLPDILPHDPVDILRESLQEETEKSPPSLYDVYNAATHAVTHTEDMSDFQRDLGLEIASELIMDDFGSIYNTTDIGESAVNDTVNIINGWHTDETHDLVEYIDREEAENLVTAVTASH